MICGNCFGTGIGWCRCGPRIMNQLQAVAMNERQALEEKTAQRTGTSTAREALVGSLGQSAPERIIGAVGPAGSKDCGVNFSGRAGSQETARGAAVDDPSWRGTTYWADLPSGHRGAGAVSLWQADRQLSRTYPVRGLQRRPATAGTYQQARQPSTALLAGGSSASGRTV